MGPECKHHSLALPYPLCMHHYFEGYFFLCTESDDPWYSKSKKAEESAKSKRRKELMDPFNDMKRFVSQTKKLSEAHSSGASRVPLIATTPTSVSYSTSRHSVVEHSSVDRKERKKNEDGKHHKEHKSKSKHKKQEKEREKEARLEEMRRQRRKRRQREQKLRQC